MQILTYEIPLIVPTRPVKRDSLNKLDQHTEDICYVDSAIKIPSLPSKPISLGTPVVGYVTYAKHPILSSILVFLKSDKACHKELTTIS